ncbi:transcriptional regulator, MarR family [Noviherbaspirillum humi]|uniref:Transcriptional regulator, MarR family n=1 Tax=Noviherbaspirillum humi TaxID=1688639 RepID=A0A239D8G1_9BURK|nr:MarR family transcriptional regulator [Noviherbaspirillum humi]SNS28569.1 transcriptional regulator, MarR family [Noviherbaspirillum humi]
MPPLFSTQTYSPDTSIGFLIKRAGQLMANNLDRALAEFDITHAQFGILLKVHHAGVKTAADLAREVVADTGAMTRMLDRLEEKSFIVRSRSESDRRVIKVALSDKGVQAAGRMTEVAVAALNHHLRGFSAEEVDLFRSFLGRMIANACNQPINSDNP